MGFLMILPTLPSILLKLNVICQHNGYAKINQSIEIKTKRQFILVKHTRLPNNRLELLKYPQLGSPTVSSCFSHSRKYSASFSRWSISCSLSRSSLSRSRSSRRRFTFSSSNLKCKAKHILTLIA